MDRDDLLLRAIAEGATTSAALAARTGLSPASVWRGLRRLMGSSHVFSPARGVYRLTASGERVLALPGGEPPAAPGRATHHTGPESLVASSVPEQDPDPAARHAGGPTAEPRPAPERTELPGSRTWTERRATVRAWLVGGVRWSRSASGPSRSSPPSLGRPSRPRRRWPHHPPPPGRTAGRAGAGDARARPLPIFQTGIPASLPDPCGVGLMPRPPQQEVAMVGANGFEPPVPTRWIVVPEWVANALHGAA